MVQHPEVFPTHEMIINLSCLPAAHRHPFTQRRQRRFGFDVHRAVRLQETRQERRQPVEPALPVKAGRENHVEGARASKRRILAHPGEATPPCPHPCSKRMFESSASATRGARSTSTTFPAPREAASSPSAPLPEKVETGKPAEVLPQPVEQRLAHDPASDATLRRRGRRARGDAIHPDDAGARRHSRARAAAGFNRPPPRP